MAHTTNSQDPCAEFGPTQKSALIWFVGAITFGALLTWKLCAIDFHLYSTNAEMIDYGKQHENRTAAATIGSEEIDGRARGDFGTARTESGQ